MIKVKKIEQAAAALMDGRKHPVDSRWKDWRELNRVIGLSNDMSKEGKGWTMDSEPSGSPVVDEQQDKA